MKDIVQRLEIGLEELILAFLIIIEVMDFFTVIPPVLEYVEKVIAIIAMSYLFYHASITKITFGQKEKNYDLLIVFSYLLFSLKTIIGFTISAAREESAMSGFYTLLIRNADIIEKTGFWIGGILLLLTAGFLLHERIKKPCILSIIHESKKAAGVLQNIVRFLSIYLILIAIFVVLFTFAIEWLAITVDAPLLMIVLFFYLFVIVKRWRGIQTESFLKKVSETSEGFYKRFISLFHSRKTITLAISGLLVLHLLVDIGHYIIPYTTGLLYPWYFAQLGPGHTPLATVMVNDFALAGSFPAQLGAMLVYVLNVLAVLMLFFGPAYAWSALYRRKKTDIGNILWLFFGSLAAFILLPVFRIGKIKSPALLGVDITTQQIPFLQNTWQVLLISLLVMGIFFILAKRNSKRTTRTGLAAVLIYFGIYLYHFFTSLAGYYASTVGILAQHRQYFIAAHLLLFFVITIMFYICGYVMFLYETYTNKTFK